MGTLKSTIKLESTDLFPTPVSFTQINNNTVEGNFSGFNTVDVSSSPITLNIAPIDTAVAYVYFQAPLANSVPVMVQDSNSLSPFIVLAPGDVAFFPYGQSITGGYDLQAKTDSGSAKLSFFIGEKA